MKSKAKGKEVALSIDEKLKAALVPEDEQPYPIPENWVWTRFEVCFRDRTSSDKKLPQKQYEEAGKYAVIDQGQQLIGGYTNDASLVFNGILPVVVFGDHTRAVKWIDFDFVQGADGVKVFQPEQKLNAKFLYYWMRIIELPDKGYSRHSKFLRETYVPLPPLPEEQRIAEKLESLLGKIREAKALLDEIPEVLQNFRQTVLAAACSGRLTEDWRRQNREVETSTELLKRISLENNIHQIKNPPYVVQLIDNRSMIDRLPDTWVAVELGKICELVPNRNPEKEKDVLFKYIDISSISNVSNAVVELKEFYGAQAPSRARRSIQKNDILFSTVRTYLRNIAMVTQDEEDMLCSTGFCVIRPFKGLQPNYFFYLVLSDAFINNVTLTQTGTSYPATSDKKIFSEMIALPPLSEQQEIVRRVESLFSKVADLEAQYKEAMEFIESLPEIILSKAFRGELVPQDPNDEPASVLLERIRAAKEKAIVTGKQTRGKKAIRSL
jgi:type I restriction enzyme S subunit